MPILSDKARHSKRSPKRFVKGDVIVEYDIEEPPNKPDNCFLFVYRNPLYKTSKKQDNPHIPRCEWEWREISMNTKVHDEPRMYHRGDIVLYTGPVLKSSGRNSHICFMPNQLYAVESRRNPTDTTDLTDSIRLLPSGAAHAGNTIPSVPVRHIRHTIKSVEDERLKQVESNKLLAQLVAVNKRYIGRVIDSYRSEDKLEFQRRLYVLQSFWYKPDYVHELCERKGISIANPGKIFESNYYTRKVFAALWADDILAKVE